MSQAATKGFYKLCLSTLVAVYLLILAGGIVRSTGSGMGCPDWPKCFGQWVPPTEVSQLPPDYKEVYSQYRHQKNIKFARYLDLLGMQETASKILSDESIKEEADFNSAKTWVEYANRVLGVLVGLFIIALCLKSFSTRLSHPRIFYWSLATLVMVIIQGWFGSIVVSTNLTSWTITVHMLLALVIVAQLFYLLYLAKGNSTAVSGIASESFSTSARWILIACMITLLIQIVFGTEVREGIDRMAASVLNRSEWVESVGTPFFIHRSFSWIVVILHLLLLLKLRQSSGHKTLTLALIILILGTLLTGTGMAYFGIPAFLQPVHLVLATMCFGLQFYLLLNLNTAHKIVLEN